MQVKKYLDAFCVYFWACTPTIFSLLTFGLFVLLGCTLTAATVKYLLLTGSLELKIHHFSWILCSVLNSEKTLRSFVILKLLSRY